MRKMRRLADNRPGCMIRHAMERRWYMRRVCFLTAGLAVLAMYAALGKGPVTVVSPLIAGYPLVKLVLSRLFLKGEPFGTLLIVGVAVTVGGVILLLLT